jgi:hexosaminidase
MSVTLALVTRWRSATEMKPSAYELRLSNKGTLAISDFAFGMSGPAAVIDPQAAIEGARLVESLSNYSLIAPPPGFVLSPGQSWEVVIHLVHPLRHWSDGVRAAYVLLADGSLIEVAVGPTETDGPSVPARKGADRFALPAEPPASLSIIPWPNSIAVEGSRVTPSGLDLRPGAPAERRAAAAFAQLVADLFPTEGLVRPPNEKAMPIAFRTATRLGPEAYEVIFGDSGTTVVAATQTGFLYGLITLGQVVRGAQHHPGKLRVPATGTIRDEPALGWRGTHLDVARQFYPIADVSRLLKLLAWNKMNRLHWHLSDDEAWRVEIDAYPELTRVGAWRGHGMALPPLLGSGARPSGGFYTKAEIRDLVALGGVFGIEIVPEIDVPGHCYAVSRALPQLRDPGEIGEYQSVQAFPNNCINPAREVVYGFVETVIDEMLELFPAGVLHLGADEVPLAAWSGSPEALALLENLAGKAAADRHHAQAGKIAEHGLADEIAGSGAAVLQAQFIGRLHRYIASKGALTGGWEEAAHGDVLDKATSYLVAWRSVEINATLAQEGYDIVASPAQHYYLDMANAEDWSEPGAGWAGWSGPEETYRFEPREGWSETQLKRLLGVQSCIWSESMTDPAVFDRLVFPRMSAVAETGWTLPERKSWERFRAFAGLMPIMYGNWAPEN